MKTKKILSIILSLVMLCSMFTVFGITASAEEAIQVSDYFTLADTIFNATKPIKIDIMSNISGGNYEIKIKDGQDITINLQGHTIVASFDSSSVTSSSLTIKGTGTIKGIDAEDMGYNAINFSGGSKLIANGVTFIGGNATGADNSGGCGIIITGGATATLRNCYVVGGKSNGNINNSCAMMVFEDSQAYVKNCTFEIGSGGTGNVDTIYVADTGKLCDIYGNKKTGLDLTQSPIAISDAVSGGNSIIINDTDGAPINSIPVTANATTPQPTYTVTIPSTINLGSVSAAKEKYRNSKTDKAGKSILLKKDFVVTASGVDNLFDGDILAVSIGIAGAGTAITGDDNTIICSLVKGESAYTEGTEFARFINDVDLAEGAENKQTGSVSINRCDITKTAEYTGTLTFNIEIKEGN